MRAWVEPLFWVASTLIQLFVIVLIVRVVMSWLFAFEVVNRRNRLAWQINYTAIQLTDPVMRPIQRILPAPGGMDLSPLVIIIGATVIQYYLALIVSRIPA
jgi:YggT family protein